jgi:hypothetical protein
MNVKEDSSPNVMKSKQWDEVKTITEWINLIKQINEIFVNYFFDSDEFDLDNRIATDNLGISLNNNVKWQNSDMFQIMFDDINNILLIKTKNNWGIKYKKY